MIDPAAVNLASAPDWSTQTEDIHCPLCEYNLRGLTEPRCPECGHTFEWAKLLDPTLRVHPYLFEHHPNHNVWSYVRTLLGLMLPGRFWRSLQPIQRIERRRLISYWMVVSAVLALLLLMVFVPHVMERRQTNKQRRVSYENMARRDARTMQYYITTYGSLETFLDRNLPLPPSWRFLEQAWTSFRGKEVLTMVLLLSSWPWAAMGILTLFRASMQQRKILPIHVLRCTIYSADMGPPLLAGAVLAGAFVMNRVYGFQMFSPAEPHVWWLLLIIVWGTLTWRLVRAYQLYLRFPHAGGVVIAAQVIFFQIVALGMLILTGYDGLVLLIWPGWQ